MTNNCKQRSTNEGMAEKMEDSESNASHKKEDPTHGSEKSSRHRVLTEKGHGEMIRTQKINKLQH